MGARYRLQRYHGHQPCLSPLRHEGLPPAFLDTSRLILRHLSREAVGGKTGLAALLAHFNIPIHRHHEALADCEATLLLYEAVAKGNQEQKATLKAAGKEAPSFILKEGALLIKNPCD